MFHVIHIEITEKNFDAYRLLFVVVFYGVLSIHIVVVVFPIAIRIVMEQQQQQ